LDALDAASVPAGPIRDLAQAFADPQIVARGLKIEAASPRAPGGSVPGVRAPILIDGAPMAAAAGAPSLGEHQDDVLRDPAWGGGED
ncbi:MAG: CoA transferase, partial [Hyphomicrobiales bacterium]|nr:CoA transferase [Hyphomicrobiales bacterium]